MPHRSVEFVAHRRPRNARTSGAMAPRGDSMQAEGTEGLCECGCGQATPLATQTLSRLGTTKGQPIRFVNGHSRRYRGPDYEVDDATGCWIWLKGKATDGYGQTWQHGRNIRAHRLYYERFKGSIPSGLVLDHLCRVKLCVNPDHLEAVTNGENVLRGEAIAARRARQTHCQHGHEFTPENTYISKRGHRVCRACEREYRRRERERRRAA
jgi:hypothetical protein